MDIKKWRTGNRRNNTFKHIKQVIAHLFFGIVSILQYILHFNFVDCSEIATILGIIFQQTHTHIHLYSF